METIQAWLIAVLNVFQVQFTLYGFTFSLWDVFLWSLVAGLLFAFIGGLFNGE